MVACHSSHNSRHDKPCMACTRTHAGRRLSNNAIYYPPNLIEGTCAIVCVCVCPYNICTEAAAAAHSRVCVCVRVCTRAIAIKEEFRWRTASSRGLPGVKVYTRQHFDLHYANTGRPITRVCECVCVCSRLEAHAHTHTTQKPLEISVPIALLARWSSARYKDLKMYF